MKSRKIISRMSVLIYWLIFIVLAGLFFTNDFGLVDIHKSAIITAVAIDSPENEVLVTAEIAVPQPSQSGENTIYTLVQGSGLTIADAMNEINSKTGFYPKLQMCKLILIGDTCQGKELFRVLGCFYRKNYSELTALIAMCQGNAYDMLALKSRASSMTSEAIRNVLSDEIEKSANANGVNLKDIAMTGYSKSAACYMPYVEALKQGTSEGGGNGDNVGGESGNEGSQNQDSSQGGQSGGGEGGGGGAQEQSGGSQSGEGGGVDFTARRTAVFSEGKFKGILDEQQSFALAVIENDIRLAVIPCDAEDLHYTLGLKNIDCGTKLKVVNGVPILTVEFSAKAEIQGVRVVVDPKKTAKDDVLSPEILKGAETELQRRFESLLNVCSETNCDVLGLKEDLYKYNYKYFDAFKDDLFSRVKAEYKINIESVN